MSELSMKGSNRFERRGQIRWLSKVLATKLDNLSLVPGTHMAERNCTIAFPCRKQL